MSNTDSFIDEVSEEVQRDRLFGLMRRYGWIAVALVLIVVGGAAWNEYRKAQTRQAAQALGDQILTALEADEAQARIDGLSAVDTEGGAAAITALLSFNLAEGEGDAAETLPALDALAANGDVPEIYRQIATFKALQIRARTGMSVEDRRTAYTALAAPGNPLRLLAEEQIALLDAEAGEIDAAVERLGALLLDAEVTAGLRQRATELILALGGDLDTVTQNQ